MRHFFMALAALMLLPLIALSSSEVRAAATTEWTTFHEPTENAFSTEIPRGWRAEGGTARRTASSANPWLKATSADGVTTIFSGDPSIPKFRLPGGLGGREGNTFNGPGGTVVATHYQTGKEFAASYGAHLLPPGAENVSLVQSQDEPAVEQRTRQKIGQALLSPISAGSALFSYDLHGQKEAAEIVVQTMLMNANSPTGSWSVFDIHGFQTRAGNEAQARAVVEHMRTSYAPNPEWGAAMMKAINDEGAMGSAMLQQQHQQFMQWSQNQTQQFNQRAAVQHQQSMNQIQAIGDRSRAQAQSDAQWHADQMVKHYGQMAVKDNNNYHQVLEIQGKHLEYVPDLHGSVAVPNY